MVLLLALSALAGGLPEVEVSWKSDAATLRIEPPAGEHIAPDASADLTLAWGGRELAFGGLGKDLAKGVALEGVRGELMSGDLHVSFCEDGGTLCRLLDVHVSGQLPVDKKGSFALAVATLEPDPEPADPYRQDAAAIAKIAFDRAALRKVPVLLDFTGVWCPPCNLFEAEVLRDAATKPLLLQFEVASVDVDDPSSWELKDRYAVTGYPTVLVARPDGTEVGRQIGYLTRELTVDFLESMAEEADPDHAAEQLTPVLAGERAWELVLRGHEDVADLMGIAADAPDHVAYRLARVHLHQGLEDATWLADNAPSATVLWVSAVPSLAQTPEGADVLKRAIEAALPTAKPIDAADLLSVRAELAAPADAPALYTKAAQALESALSGDPLRDKGYYTTLADMKAGAGDVDGALAVLDRAATEFPDEPTWALTGSRLLLEADRPADALARAEAGMSVAWGDNRLRLVKLQVEALMALSRPDDAVALARKTLAEHPAPAEGVDVRTHRYRTQLAEAAGLETP